MSRIIELVEPPSICDEQHVNAIKRLLVDMAHERTVDSLLRLVVERLGNLADVALVRIWLLAPGDICGECHFRQECPDQTACLHLFASAGNPTDKRETWSETDGRFRRFPLGVRKVGHIAASREPVEVDNIDSGSRWIADPDWASREGIRGFVGQPLLFRGEMLGVLGVFLHVPLVDDAVTWLRMVTDHVAAAIANARAFEEVERLRTQLEDENEYLRDEVKVASGCCGGIIGQSRGLQKSCSKSNLWRPPTRRC